VARTVTFPTASGDGQGLLAVPQAPGPGVLLLPNFRGLAPDTVAAAQRLARAGCPTLAVDFLHRVPLRFDDFYEQGPAALLSLDLGTLGACGLPGQQGRLRGCRPAHRRLRRPSRGCPGLRLRPVSQRP